MLPKREGTASSQGFGERMTSEPASEKRGTGRSTEHLREGRRFKTQQAVILASWHALAAQVRFTYGGASKQSVAGTSPSNAD